MIFSLICLQLQISSIDIRRALSEQLRFKVVLPCWAVILLSAIQTACTDILETFPVGTPYSFYLLVFVFLFHFRLLRHPSSPQPAYL
jgi:hypothetical protein